ncbi:MAG: hypothetical protein ACI83D_000047 [Planctomycetota bacterium]|jgi:hypothetical protein
MITDKILSPIRILRIIGIVLIFSGLVWYAFIQLKPLIQGPEITVRALRNGDQVTHSPLYIEGVSERTVRLFVSTKPISIINQKFFNHTIALAPGVNHIDITAEDRFKKAVTKTIELYYTPADQPTPDHDSAIDLNEDSV